MKARSSYVWARHVMPRKRNSFWGNSRVTATHGYLERASEEARMVALSQQIESAVALLSVAAARAIIRADTLATPDCDIDRCTDIDVH